MALGSADPRQLGPRLANREFRRSCRATLCWVDSCGWRQQLYRCSVPEPFPPFWTKRPWYPDRLAVQPSCPRWHAPALVFGLADQCRDSASQLGLWTAIQPVGRSK